MLERKIRSAGRRAIWWIQEDEKQKRYNYDDAREFAYSELNAVLVQILEDRTCRPSYTWGVLHSAHLAKSIGVDRISVVEFGVAGEKASWPWNEPPPRSNEPSA